MPRGFAAEAGAYVVRVGGGFPSNRTRKGNYGNKASLSPKIREGDVHNEDGEKKD